MKATEQWYCLYFAVHIQQYGNEKPTQLRNYFRHSREIGAVC